MGLMKRWFKRNNRRAFRLFQIEPTLQCGLSCVMCPWTELRPGSGHMEWETFSRIREYLPQTEAVDLTGGGEPLKQPHLPEMVRAAKEAGCQVGFSTNGVHLTEMMAQELMRAGLDWVSFSVDAATAELYESIRLGASFNQVTGNIARLSELKARAGGGGPKMMMVIVLMTGSPRNVHQLPDYIRLAKRLGVEQVIAKNLDVILRAGDDGRRVFTHEGSPAPEVEEAVSAAQAASRETGVRLRLYALQPQEQAVCEHDPLHSVFFNYQGNISPCITLAYAENRIFDGQEVHAPCQRFGNIRREALPSVWEQESYRDFRRQFELRRNWEQQALMDAILQQSAGSAEAMPPAPESCRTCYYLYGI